MMGWGGGGVLVQQSPLPLRARESRETLAGLFPCKLGGTRGVIPGIRDPPSHCAIETLGLLCPGTGEPMREVDATGTGQ